MTKNEMVAAVEWVSCNKLLINFKKTNCLLFASDVLLQRRNSSEIKICGTLLNFTNVTKYLGILIDHQVAKKLLLAAGFI